MRPAIRGTTGGHHGRYAAFYNGTYYAIDGKRMSFQQNKTREDDTFILSLPAIADAMKHVGISFTEILLGVGLPVDIYGTQKEAFRKYFLRGNVSFEFEGKPYHCFIADSKVFAQGHAALCKYYQQLKGCNNITLVDIGWYTVDILTYHDFKVDRGSCASLRMGTIMLFNAIRAELQAGKYPANRHAYYRRNAGGPATFRYRKDSAHNRVPYAALSQGAAQRSA